MIHLKPTHVPTLKVDKSFHADRTCDFCKSRTVPKVKLRSSDPDRRLVVYLCEMCTTELVEQLVQAALVWKG